MVEGRDAFSADVEGAVAPRDRRHRGCRHHLATGKDRRQPQLGLSLLLGLRDATFTLFALFGAGFVAEAEAWRGWLLRAVAGSPKDLQIMYGVASERRLVEFEVPWLPGYEKSSPVRIGNAAAGQLQLDVYGEVLDERERHLEASDPRT